jgi:hypothetical protein
MCWPTTPTAASLRASTPVKASQPCRKSSASSYQTFENRSATIATSGDNLPVSTLVEVKGVVDPKMKVEIECQAYVD